MEGQTSRRRFAVTPSRIAMTAIAITAAIGLFWLMDDGGPITLSSASLDEETVELPDPTAEAAGDGGTRGVVNSTAAAPSNAAAVDAGSGASDTEATASDEGAVAAAIIPAMTPKIDLVRVEPDGRAQIAGSASRGREVVMRLDGVEVARSKVGPDGSFYSALSLGGSEVPRSLTVEDEEGLAATLMLQPTSSPEGVAAEALETAGEAPGEGVPDGGSLQASRAGEKIASGEMAATIVAGPKEGDRSSEAAPLDRQESAPSEDSSRGEPLDMEAADAGAQTSSALPPSPVRSASLASNGDGVAAEPSAERGSVGFADTTEGADLPAGPPNGARPDGDDPAGEPEAVELAGTETSTAAQIGGGGLRATASSSDVLPETPTSAVRPEAVQATDPDPVAPAEIHETVSVPNAPDTAPEVLRPSSVTTAAAGSAQPAGIETVAAPQPPKVLIADRDGVRLLQAPPLRRGLELDTISYDEVGAVELTGRADAAEASAVRVYVDGRAVLDAPTAADGAWTGALDGVAAGTYTLRVDALDRAGKVVRRVELPFLRETPEAVAAAGPAVVTVQPGNTLWGIARETYGDGLLYVRVFEANREAIRNPDLIYPGQIFDVPISGGPASPPQPRTP